MVVKKMGSKNALFLGTTGYWLFIQALLDYNKHLSGLNTQKKFLLYCFWLLLNYSVVGGILGTILPLLIGHYGDGVLNTQLSALLGIIFKHHLLHCY
ncbi:UNC93-like protein [Salvia divinorum]|uniref:UNC93-like protein n=1 Tax=Salvia divinorum TaxID=28513 RepID=A0ABD1H252_SALDI